MSAPLTYGISAKAKHADCAAFFLNWVATNQAAREIDVDGRRLATHGGPTDLAIPPVPRAPLIAADARRRQGDRQGQRRDGLHRERHRRRSTRKSWTPQLQKLVGGQQTGAGMLKAVQAEYEKELAG